MMVDDRLKYGTDLVKEGVVFLKGCESRTYIFFQNQG